MNGVSPVAGLVGSILALIVFCLINCLTSEGGSAACSDALLRKAAATSFFGGTTGLLGGTGGGAPLAAAAATADGVIAVATALFTLAGDAVDMAGGVGVGTGDGRLCRACGVNDQWIDVFMRRIGLRELIFIFYFYFLI